MKFHRITLEDKSWIDRYLQLDHMEGCGYSFCSMMLWKDIYEMEVSDYKETLCHKCTYTNEKHTYHEYSFPAGPGNKREVIEDLLAYAKEQGEKLILGNVEKDSILWLQEQFPDRFEIVTTQAEWDYVYSVEALTHLAGSKYHGKRNHIARFMDDNDWRYESLSKENVEACKKMCEKWYEIQCSIGNESVMIEKPGLFYLLEHFERLNLKGGLLYKGDRLVAFTLGEAFRGDTFLVHIEKAFSDVQGAYSMINNLFVLHEMQEFSFVNREEDDGIEGLRRAKKSYYPVKMIEKYSAIQK